VLVLFAHAPAQYRESKKKISFKTLAELLSSKTRRDVKETTNQKRKKRRKKPDNAPSQSASLCPLRLPNRKSSLPLFSLTFPPPEDTRRLFPSRFVPNEKQHLNKFSCIFLSEFRYDECQQQKQNARKITKKPRQQKTSHATARKQKRKKKIHLPASNRNQLEFFLPLGCDPETRKKSRENKTRGEK
jgi:hypothetical protein